MIEQRGLGRSGLQVPVVGMGTWKTFDVNRPADEEQRHRLVDLVLERGATLFDSSPMYGAAERVLGAALDGRREAAIVATKVWTPDDREAERQIQRSLGFYGGRIDIYQVHNLVAWRKRLEALERLRETGGVGVVGITHYAHSAFSELMDIMRTGRVASIQIPYNVRDRAVEERVLPLAAELNIGVIVMQPLGTGALARQRVSDDRLEPLAPFGVKSWPQALLKWILSDPRISTVIPATSSADHALENIAAGAPPWFGPDERAYVARLAG